MLQKKVSILFSLIFFLFIVSPTIQLVIDETVDIVAVFSSSSEEERGEETHADLKILFPIEKTTNTSIMFVYNTNSLDYLHKKYPKLYLNIISPPPDLLFS